jgi:UDP-3-O-[3-hydroxymyristoyl] glucosamine N-acyltransferase
MKLSLIAHCIGGQIIGNPDLEIRGVKEIGQAEEGDLAFLLHPRYLSYLKNTKASAIIVGNDFPVDFPVIIKVANPYKAFAQVIDIFNPSGARLSQGVHPTSILGKGAKISPQASIGPFVFLGEGTSVESQSQIYPFVYIGNHCRVGRGTKIFPQVFLGDGCEVGDGVIIHSGAVLGSDGFGFVREGSSYRKIPQVGGVVVEDEVEIGANVTIDRATLGVTRIGRGTKIDNLVHIGHNVQVGENTMIVAQVGISGSTRIGKVVRIAGQAGLAGHIQIGDKATIAAQAGVTKSVPPGSFVSGYPARPHRLAKKISACQARLPDLFKRVKELEETIKKLEGKIGEQATEDS